MTSISALQVTAYEQPPKLCEQVLPAPAAGEAQIRIKASAFNFADTLMVKGTYQATPEPPFTLGLEYAGEITALGEGVDGLTIGARVGVFAGEGGMATGANVDAARCVLLPDGLSFEDAAALQVAYGTSHMALDYKARLQSGERLIVTGAAGGVGLTAVEIGKLMGAEVIAIARGEEKLAVAKAAGADHLLDATDPDLKDKIKAFGGADVVYDAVGGDLYDACFRATNPDGRILLIGFAGGNLPTIKPNHMLVKNITAIGFYWGGYFDFNPAPLQASLTQIFDWAAAGQITPHISHRLPLARAAEGLELLKDRKSTGKIIVTP